MQSRHLGRRAVARLPSAPVQCDLLCENISFPSKYAAAKVSPGVRQWLGVGPLYASRRMMCSAAVSSGWPEAVALAATGRLPRRTAKHNSTSRR